MIHEEIMNLVQSTLQDALIDSIPEDDPARAGVIVLGPLQGNPDPDEARISVSVYENDPDRSSIFKLSDDWLDEVFEIECGGAITWYRRFTIISRCLLETSREDLVEARHIASTVRSRIEKAILRMPVSGIGNELEYVSRGPLSENIKGEMIQSGGPPDSYDFHIKVRFELLTTALEG